MFATTGSVDDCNVLPETKYVRTCLFVDTTQFLSVRRFLPPMAAAKERLEFHIKLSLGAPLRISPPGYLLKSFPQVDTSARQRRLKSELSLPR